MSAPVLASISILLWASLATLGLRLAHVPPFLLVGLALGIGCLPSLPELRKWFIRPSLMAFGTFGIFGYHFLLFFSFHHAPAIEANLMNYTWPVLIVLLSAAILPGHRLGARHLVGASLAFAGAVLILSGGKLALSSEHLAGYGLALAAALVWALYSVLTKRIGAFPTSAVGGFCFLSSLLALACHEWIEPPAALTTTDWILIALLGLGPMGIAFYTWDAGLKKGDPRLIGTLSYFTPLLSTALLSVAGGKGSLSWSAAVALGLILSGAVVSARASRPVGISGTT